MGGAKAGEVASGLAAAALKENDGGSGGEERVTALIQEANRRVFTRANEDREAAGMGTTMTVALVEGDRVAFGHVGDSRAYRIRDGEIEQLTDDHSLVAELVRGGKLTPEEAESHPQRSVITRAVGTEPEVDDVTIIRSIENHRGDLDAAAKALVGAANRGGGEDNITVVFFELSGEPLEDTAVTEAAPAVAQEDEDTLSGIDEIPAVAGEPSSGPRAERRRRRRVLPIVLAFAVLLIIAAAVLWLLDHA